MLPTAETSMAERVPMKKMLVIFAVILLASAALSGTLFAAKPNCAEESDPPEL